MTDIWFCLPTLLEAWFAILMGDFLRDFLAAGGVFLALWVWGRDRMRHRRIQAQFPGVIQMKREFAFSMSTVLVFSVVGLAIFIGIDAGVWRLYDDIGEHGWLYYGASMALIIVAHDAYFYWAHRLMHHRRLFRLFHRTHHRSRNPSPWAALAFDPAEALVQALFLPLFLALVPIHGSAVLVFLIHMIVRNALGHSGFEVMPRAIVAHPIFGWFTSVTHHDLHHSSPASNYGLYFTWWDRLMGTENPDYQDRYAQVMGREPVKKAGDRRVGGWFAAVVLAAGLVAATGAAAETPSVLGDWATAGYEARVEIERCGNSAALCATVVWLWNPVDERGGHRTDRQNPDPALRSRPLVGLVILDGLRPTAPGAWGGGRIYDPATGNQYGAALRLKAPGILEVEGCLAIFCRTQVWRRTEDVRPMVSRR